jgi:hypothetical protein
VNNTGTKFDEIFYQEKCRTIDEICRGEGLSGVNVTFCFNESTSAHVPINDVITRTLSAEEFY